MRSLTPYLKVVIRAAAFAAISAALILPPQIFGQLPTQGPVKPPQQQKVPPPPAQQKQQPQYSLTVQSQLVQVNTVVTDQAGNIITGLKPGNFQIFDDNQQQPITNFEPNTAPITIVLLMEFSNHFGMYFAQLAPYLTYGFADHLGPNDWVAVVTYDLKPHILVDFTHNKDEVKNAIQTLYFPGFSESNEFDALIDTIDRLKDVQGKKAILLASTGFDTFSKHTLDQTYNALKQTNVTVFSIGVFEMVAVGARPAIPSVTCRLKMKWITLADSPGVWLGFRGSKARCRIFSIRLWRFCATSIRWAICPQNRSAMANITRSRFKWWMTKGNR